MKNKREIRFAFEELVEVYDPKNSIQLNGMMDCVQTTEGYAEINNENQVDTLIIDKCVVYTDDKTLINTKVLNDKDVYIKIMNGVCR